jgi:hypothetical protein
MIIKQRHLDRIMAEQRAMFPLEQLLVDAPCALTPFQCPQCPNCDLSTYHVSNRIVVIEPCKWKADYFPVSALGQREMNTYNPCNFFCEDCDMPVTIHRYGRPFIDGRGYVVRRCLNDGTNRAHTNDDYPRCTDKHVLLKRRQIRWNMTPEGSGIGRHTIEQMVDPAGQMERERQRQLERETTNVRPSEFDPEIRQRAMADGRIQRITSRPDRLFGTIEYVDPLVELTRRTTPAHTRADCGGCAGYYKPNGQLVRHRTLSAQELL